MKSLNQFNSKAMPTAMTAKVVGGKRKKDTKLYKRYLRRLDKGKEIKTKMIKRLIKQGYPQEMFQEVRAFG